MTMEAKLQRRVQRYGWDLAAEEYESLWRSNDACDAAFIAGPVALAWSRFDDEVRARVCRRYLRAIESFRDGQRYRIPAEFVIAAAFAPIDTSKR